MEATRPTGLPAGRSGRTGCAMGRVVKCDLLRGGDPQDERHTSCLRVTRTSAYPPSLRSRANKARSSLGWGERATCISSSTEMGSSACALTWRPFRRMQRNRPFLLVSLLSERWRDPPKAMRPARGERSEPAACWDSMMLRNRSKMPRNRSSRLQVCCLGL